MRYLTRYIAHSFVVPLSAQTRSLDRGQEHAQQEEDSWHTHLRQETAMS